MQIRSYKLIYLMGFLTSLCSFVASYSHVFLSQLETIIVQKDNLAPSESEFVLTVVVSASFMGEIIGTSADRQVLFCTSGWLIPMEREELWSGAIWPL